MRILLVEDDPELGSGVTASLKREHFAVDWVTDGPSASTALTTSPRRTTEVETGMRCSFREGSRLRRCSRTNGGR